MSYRLPRIAFLGAALVLAGVLGLAGGPRVATAGNTYYVANGGGGNACSFGSPCGTINTGISKLQGTGDTLYIRGGTYTEVIPPFSYPAGSSWGNAVPGGSVVWIGAYKNGDTYEQVIIDGIHFNGVLQMQGADYVVWDHLHIRGRTWGVDAVLGAANATQRFQNGVVEQETLPYITDKDQDGSELIIVIGKADADPSQPLSRFEFINNDLYHAVCCYAFYVQGQVASLLIDGNRIHHENWYGMQIYDETCRNNGTICSRNVTIRNNEFYANGHGVNGQTGGRANGCAITLNTCGNCQMYNNTFYDNYCGIEVTRYSQDTLVANNTFYHNPNDGNYAAVVFRDNTQRTYVVNNVVYTSGSWMVGADFGGSQVPNPGYTQVTEENNTFSSGEPPTTEFVNLGARDFHLQASSGNRNNGTNLSSYFTMDRDGNTRPSSGPWSRGAYQFGGGSIPLPAPTNLRILAQ